MRRHFIWSWSHTHCFPSAFEFSILMEFCNILFKLEFSVWRAPICLSNTNLFRSNSIMFLSEPPCCRMNGFIFGIVFLSLSFNVLVVCLECKIKKNNCVVQMHGNHKRSYENLLLFFTRYMLQPRWVLFRRIFIVIFAYSSRRTITFVILHFRIPFVRWSSHHTLLLAIVKCITMINSFRFLQQLSNTMHNFHPKNPTEHFIECSICPRTRVSVCVERTLCIFVWDKIRG